MEQSELYGLGELLSGLYKEGYNFKLTTSTFPGVIIQDYANDNQAVYYWHRRVRAKLGKKAARSNSDQRFNFRITATAASGVQKFGELSWRPGQGGRYAFIVRSTSTSKINQQEFVRLDLAAYRAMLDLITKK